MSEQSLPIKIFISYRRDDSQYVTDSVHDHLVRYFGAHNVFLDVEDIPPGVDFRKYLSDQVAGIDVVLAIIGPRWASMMKQRAHQPNDFVRIEIESALEQNKLIIPVLVMEAEMPDFADLPSSVGKLQWLQSAVIRRKPDLEHSCSKLAESIRQHFNGKATTAVLPDHDSSALEILPPPFDWVDIPAGRVILEDDHGIYQVEAFSIAKYPVTVAQYLVFMEDNGYGTQRWWSKSGWEWLQDGSYTTPRFWNQEKWQSLWQHDHPVVGVSWFEAYAFTQWLSEKTGDNIYLPSEQQWQRAAQGDDNRTYPWGNIWDSARCNHLATGEDWQTRRAHGNTTSSVTAFEGRGNSPYGVVDMVGNVWEWTRSAYDTAQEVDIEDTKPARVLRGGSYAVTAYYSRSACRSWLPPGNWYVYAGFRCACS